MAFSKDGGLPQSTGRGRRFRWSTIVGSIAILVFTFHACTHMVAAGDTWVAMACGRHFSNHGVDTVEPFSANSHAAGPTEEEMARWPRWSQRLANTIGQERLRRWHPTGWINQNWLTHVIFYQLTTTLGSEEEPYFDALVFWKFGIYLLAVVCLYFTCRTIGVDQAWAAMACCCAMFIGRSFFDIRPAAFSNLLTAMYLLILALTSYRNGRYIWLIVPLIVFWANVHGGYIYAFIMLVPFVGWHLLIRLPKRWMLAGYSILTWLVLCLLAHQFLQHEWLNARSLQRDWVLYLWLTASVASIATTLRKDVSDGAHLVLHAIISGILVLVLGARYLPGIPPNLSPQGRQEFVVYVNGARWAHLAIAFFAAALAVAAVSARDRIVRVLNGRDIVHAIAAGSVAFVAMVIFNPYHLTNLTHTFVISISKHAERWRDVVEWHRAFDWTNPVGTAVPFLVMYVAAWLCLAVWVIGLTRAARVIDRSPRKEIRRLEGFTWPRIDLALVVIAALTVFMAVKSRRFIPMAAFAACPVIALLVQQSFRVLGAQLNYHRGGQLEASPLPLTLRRGLLGVCTIAVLALGTFWALKFKRVYLDFWPSDEQHTSMFMRMTASDAKPFDACRFIRTNKLSGNMFNYWTEGGFLAWGQVPDPETGRTPLQLFMDGRAQAAYDRAAFDRWTEITSGGPVCVRAVIEGKELTPQQYAEAGQWVTKQLQENGAWVVVMPVTQFDDPFVGVIERCPDWRIAYMDKRQKLFVNINTERGKTLYDGMFTGKVTYPDENTADLVMGYSLLLFQSKSRQRTGLDMVVRGFRRNPSPGLMQALLLAARLSPDLGPQIDQVCVDYVAQFEEARERYENRDGYVLRLEAARLALMQLEGTARVEGDTRQAETLASLAQRYLAERNSIIKQKVW